MGRRRRKGRNVNGVLLFDKPLGETSNKALQQVKHLFQASKAGHTGSLDPLADGLLPICFGKATRISAFLLDADKHYWTRVRLGVKTSTADAEGEIVEERPVDGIDCAGVEAVLARFRGDIEQIPPMYSALKHEGQRLYKLAREGVEVERKPRPVTIHSLELTACELPEIELSIRCSKGTYVRTLAEDIGDALGCGAHVTALRRIGVGLYDESTAPLITMEQLRQQAEEGFAALDSLLLPLDSALMDWPEVRLNADMAYYLKMGQAVMVPKSPAHGWVRLYDNKENFMGVGEIDDDGKVAPRRLI